MNGDLISREALIKELEQRHLDDVFIKCGLPPMRKMSLECNRALKTQGDAIRDVINGLPAVDAEPVRHGKWMNVCEILPPEYHDKKRCSVCANFSLHDRLGRVRTSCYCPNCGAKMRGD